MSRMIYAGLALALLIGSAGVAGAQTVSVSKMAFMTLTTQGEIAASGDRVWASLTDADKAQSWCPLWKKAAKAEALTKIGNSMDFTDSWGNAGKTVVVFVNPGKELRLAHVPDNGSYVCQVRFQLTPKGKATLVDVTEQYSDALEAPVDKDTAAKTKDEIAGYLSALKGLAEGK